LEGFLQSHGGNGEFSDLIGGEFEEFEVGHDIVSGCFGLRSLATSVSQNVVGK
jgi:hypothetical protein